MAKCWYCAADRDGDAKNCPFCGSCAEKPAPALADNQGGRAATVRQTLTKSEEELLKNIGMIDKQKLCTMGKLFYEGSGVSKNFEAAFKLWHAAAIKGDSESMFLLGGLFERGEGTTQSLESALWWYTESAKLGGIEARNTLAERFKGKIDTVSEENLTRGDNDLKLLINKVRPYCVELTCVSSTKNASQGSGCIISPNYIVTNAHVVINNQNNKPHRDIILSFHKSTGAGRRAIKVDCFDMDEDIAVCSFADSRVDADSFPRLVDSHSMECGDKVFTIGNALGRGLSLSCGVVAKEVESDVYGRSEVLQTDMNINGGNSGGAVFDNDGNIVGLMTFVPANAQYGMSFAVTSNTIARFMKKNKLEL